MFVLGPAVLADFLRAISAQASSPLIWAGNHSVRAFAADDLGGQRFWGVSDRSEWWLLGLVAISLLVTIAAAWRRPVRRVDGCLLLAATLVALLVPPVSNDYTLPLLIGPVGLMFLELSATRNPRLAALLASVLAAAYAVTFFPYTSKPPMFDNNLPLLMIMLVSTAGLAVLRRPANATAIDQVRT
jgi:hypothetical protein